MPDDDFKSRTGRLVHGESYTLGRRKFVRGRDYGFTADEFTHLRDNASFQFDAANEENEDANQLALPERSEADSA